MKEQYVYVSGSNYFKERCLNEMVELLDAGKRIRVGIDCIGHTRNNNEQENYREALEKHYGDNLEVIYKDGWCSYSYEYQLKGGASNES